MTNYIDDKPVILLPFEIWLRIAELVVTRPWTKYQFHRPKYDLCSLTGFKNSCHTKHINQFLELDESKIRKIRYLFITFNSVTSPTQVKDFINKFKKNPQVLSIILHVNDTSQPFYFLPYDTVRSSVFCSLRRLDVRFSTPELLYNAIQMHSVDIPNLTELRLMHDGDPQPIDRYISITDFSDQLTKFLSPLTNLRYLSTHGGLDVSVSFDSQCQIHNTSFFHLEPSEGYERHFADCSLCIQDYDFRTVRDREISLSLELATKHLILEKILWSNLWQRTRDDENGQNCLVVYRRNSCIELISDE
ncbi:hypothetical protein PNOK_0511300 [Pyrrhoderma noxium]|uniref:Uncharacterized protein n=1 Tax=Pyrrhoderma noxium TaxID=2282107 RepID=A0A286UKX5_9AGAM|nr:hypothetical protein PNOK_0511300 [Pyrrhoderma noxium]